MDAKERDRISTCLTMIGRDAEMDATKAVPFTALGIGTIHGELLAMIHALAGICRQLLNAVVIDNE